MNKFLLILSIIFLISCSFTKTDFWTKSQKIEALNKDKIKIFQKEKVLEKEFNPNVLLDLRKFTKFTKNSNYLTNDLGINEIDIELKNFSKFKFSKIKDFNYFEPELNFDGKNFIFFDDKGNLLKFDNSFKLVWKKNYYSKKEKKLKPILTLTNNGKILVVFDNISKFYALNLETGNLIWSKTSYNPSNSQIKILNNQIYSIDLNNVLRSFSLLDGKELWSFKMSHSGSNPPTIFEHLDEQYVIVVATGSSTLKQTYPEISEYGDKIYAFKLAKNSN